MRKLFFAASALTMLAAGPALAQMAPAGSAPMGNPMMMGGMGGMGAGSGKSCVQNGAFVPCPMPGMQAGMEPGMGMAPEPRRRMSKREMRMQRKMQRDAM